MSYSASYSKPSGIKYEYGNIFSITKRACNALGVKEGDSLILLSNRNNLKQFLFSLHPQVDEFIMKYCPNGLTDDKVNQLVDDFEQFAITKYVKPTPKYLTNATRKHRVKINFEQLKSTPIRKYKKIFAFELPKFNNLIHEWSKKYNLPIKQCFIVDYRNVCELWTYDNGYYVAEFRKCILVKHL